VEFLLHLQRPLRLLGDVPANPTDLGFFLRSRVYELSDLNHLLTQAFDIPAQKIPQIRRAHHHPPTNHAQIVGALVQRRPLSLPNANLPVNFV
jgi:hypothetical protein